MLESPRRYLDVDVRYRWDRGIVHVRGEVDLSTVAVLRDALEEAIRGCGRIEVDLSETTFIDAAGLSALLAAHRRLEQRGGAVVVCEPARIVRRVLDASGVATMIEIRDGR